MAALRLVPALALSSSLWACAPPTAVAPARVAIRTSASIAPPDNPFPDEEETEPALAARDHAAPPLSGGTLTLAPDASIALVSDPERDRVWAVGLVPARVLHEVVLDSGDEPGRSVFDASGRAHVVLRGGGAIVSFAAADGEGFERRRVCPAPRGIATDGDRVHVACAGGELVTFAADGGEPIAARRVAPDLRDVGVDPDGSIWVTRFRSAEMIRVADTIHTERIETETVAAYAAPFGAAVAWRTISGEGGQWMLHQRHRKAALSAVRQYYGSESAAMFGAITYFADGVVQHSTAITSPTSVLPIDAAVIDERHLAVVFGGTGAIDVVDARTGAVSNGPLSESPGRAVAVAYHPNVGLVVQYRAQTAIEIFAHPRQVGGEAYVALGPSLVADRGFDIFHETTQEGVACASCHPEGSDDGHVWIIPSIGPRRTQPLTGGILGGAPYHWNGELATFDALMAQVFVQRMGGTPLGAADVRAVGVWLDGVRDPRPPVAPDEEAIARGRELFEGSTGCAGCHSGPRLTDGLSHDVGTGGEMQTPSLRGLAMRAPYLHDGRAPTIEARLREHHTEGHGRVAHLDDAGIADLCVYLASL